MIFYLLIALALIIAIVWLLHLAIQEPGFVSIIYGSYSIEMTIVSLLISVIIIGLVGFVLLWLLTHILRLPSAIAQRRQQALATRAGRELVQGLISLTEGRWHKAEKLLIRNAEYNETPVLNYLAAARAAQMQGDHKKRDNYLRDAIENDHSADIAVSIAQAELQLNSKETEQAQATLERLWRLSPGHPYVAKLLAKVYYRLQDWEHLYEILPELSKHKLLKNEERHKIEAATLKGLFEHYAKENNISALKTRWKKLPTNIQSNTQAVLLYCKALLAIDACELCANVIKQHLAKNWDEKLIEFYGKLRHENLKSALTQAESWLLQQPDSPMLHLTLARLYQQAQLWGKSRNFFITSLHHQAHSEAYLELAELLQHTGEEENAHHCYEQGLRFCITRKSRPLALKPVLGGTITTAKEKHDDSIHAV